MRPHELFARLVDYPAPGMLGVLDDGISSLLPAFSESVNLLKTFRVSLEGLGLGRLEEIYTETFDMREELSLYLGHHLFGEDWRRSAFMARLKERYREAGVSSGAEMPDHLSVVLRFLGSQKPCQETEELLLACVIPAVSRVLENMRGQENPYSAVLQALLFFLQRQDKRESQSEEVLCSPFSS